MLATTALSRRVRKAWVMSDLSVRQHARGDGHCTPPLPRGEALSQTEMNIECRYSDRRGTLERGREGALHTHRLGLIQTALSEDERTFPSIATACKLAIHDKRLQFNPAWQQDLERIRTTEKERDRFKSDNRLTREAHNPDPMLAVGVGALALVAETAFNAILLAKVFDGGLAEGAVTAVTLAAPNVALGVTAGWWGLRGLHCIRPALRQLGAAVTAVALSTAVVWNLYIGQVRALVELRAAANDPLLPGDWRTAAANLILDPVAAFQSGPAFTLVLVGLGVVAVALWDGLDGFSDRVPGFSRLDRRYHAAVARAHARKSRFVRVVDPLTRRGIRSINRRHRAVHSNLAEALGFLARAAGVIIHYNERLADQLWVHRAVLAAYRLINRTARNELDVPQRFDQPPLANAADTLPAFDWHAMHTNIEGRAASACNAAQTASADLQRYSLNLKQEIEAELAAVTRRRVLLAPLLLTTREAV